MPLVENQCLRKAIKSIHILKEKQILMGDRRKITRKEKSNFQEVYLCSSILPSELIGSLKINGLVLRKQLLSTHISYYKKPKSPINDNQTTVDEESSHPISTYVGSLFTFH